MAIKEIFIFIACLSALCGFGDSVDIQCSYGTNTWYAVGSVYECVPQNTLNIKSRESAVINSVSGSHDSGESNSDVTGFYSDSSSRVIEYFPRNLENIFPNLKMIRFNYGRLKEIQQNDLRPFTKLVYLNLGGNDIEYLEDGLFAYNPELQYVSFWSNKIIHIGSHVFENLNQLAWLYLNGNKCIDMGAEDSQPAVIKIINEAKSKCQTYSDKIVVLSLKSKIDHSQFESSKATQTSINQLINSQTQTCSAITENVLKVSQYLNSMNQDMVKKSDSTDIKNNINNVRSDISTKITTIGSDLNTKFTSLNSYLTANIEMEVKEMSQLQSKGLSTLTDKQTRTSDKIEEVKVVQQDIQQKTVNIEKHLKDLLGSHNASSSGIAERITKVDTSLSEIIKQKSDDIQKSMTSSHDGLRSEIKEDIGDKILELKEYLKDKIEQKTTDLDKSMDNRITTLEANLNIALRGKEANITNDVSSRTFNMTKRISEIETAMNNGMMSIKDDLATEISAVNEKLSTMESNMTSIKNDLSVKLEDINSKIGEMEASMVSKSLNLGKSIIELKSQMIERMNEGISIMENATTSTEISTLNNRMTSIESNVNTKLSSMDAKISNLTLILQDFIKLSTRSSNRFQSELKDRLQVTNYKIDESSIIQDYTKLMLIGSCALLVTLVLVIIYKKILSQPDDLDY